LDFGEHLPKSSTIMRKKTLKNHAMHVAVTTKLPSPVPTSKKWEHVPFEDDLPWKKW